MKCGTRFLMNFGLRQFAARMRQVCGRTARRRGVVTLSVGGRCRIQMQKCRKLPHSENALRRLCFFICNAFIVFAAFAANLRSKVFKERKKTQCSEERLFLAREYSTELNAANAADTLVEHFSQPLKSHD